VMNRSTKAGTREKVVILGTGWSSFRMLQTLSDEYKIVVVSPRNHFLFTPLLASTTVGTLEFRSIVEPLRQNKIMDHVKYYQGECVGFDPERNVITCKDVYCDDRFEVTYDKLVIGVGARNNTFGIPGVQENAFFLKELRHARAIRRHLLQQFEHSAMPTMNEAKRKHALSCVIVGGGPTGVEFAAELCDFLWKDLPNAYPEIDAKDVKVTLVEAGPKILSAFNDRLINKALKALRDRGADVRVDSRVKQVAKDYIELECGDKLPYGTLVWSTGVGPHDVIAKAPFKTDHHRIVTDQHLRVLGHDNIWAFGDCASPEGTLLSATAQVAQQQGKYLAKSFNLMAEGKPIPKFKFNFLGMMANLGDHKSILQSQKVELSGLASWVAWRAAYFTRLGSLVNKVQVPYDWLKTAIFGRDVTIF